MNFYDYTMRDLVGKTVLHTTSGTVTRQIVKRVTKISETLKTGFRIEGEPNRLFSYRTGNEILTAGQRRVTYGTISVCSLVTSDEALAIIDHAKTIADKRALVQVIVDQNWKLMKLPLKDLKTFVTKINKLKLDGVKRPKVKS